MASATAWYVVPSGRLLPRWFNILHWPYTLWHLSYPAMGAALAVDMSWSLLGWTILAFLLGMGIAAHCLDLVKGDPLRLGVNPTALKIVALVALSLAAAIGGREWMVGHVSPWMWIVIVAGMALAVGYNLEWPGLHGNWQFAAWWAVFPLLAGYLAQGIEWTPALVPLVIFAFLTAMGQRVLSTRARWLRRETGEVGTVDEPYLAKGWDEPILCDNGDYGGGKVWLLQPLDGALKWMSFAMPLIAIVMLV